MEVLIQKILALLRGAPDNIFYFLAIGGAIFLLYSWLTLIHAPDE
jgi:hypothetical protein